VYAQFFHSIPLGIEPEDIVLSSPSYLIDTAVAPDESETTTLSKHLTLLFG
jgi:hypothetical protein